MSPLRKLRKQRGWRLQHVIDRLREMNCSLDTGNLSRIERCKQSASPAMAEKLCLVFGGELTELQILYPERFMEQPSKEEAREVA